jgi:hypothetical protein
VWVKLSDDFSVRCAQARLSDAAVRTHTDALCWIMDREMGPVLSPRDLRRALESEHADAAVRELLAAGWWVREGSDGSVRVIECMADQPEPEVIAKRREATADRKRRERLRRAGLDVDPETGEIVSRRDVPRDGTRDPGRDGTGRDGTGESTYGTEDEGDGVAASDEPVWPAVAGPGSVSGPPPADESPGDLGFAVGRVDLGHVPGNGLATVTATRPADAEGWPVPAGQLSLNCDDCAEPLDPELINQGMTTCLPCVLRGDS